VDYTVSPLIDDGFNRGAVVTFVDATQRRQTSADLEHAAAALRQGIRDGEMRLYYQPKVNIVSGRCGSVEALIRWQQKDALVFPDEFIPMAEQTGAIADLTCWVIDEAARQAASWRSQGHDLHVAINLSAISLGDSSVVSDLAAAADKHHVPISSLEVEITETMLAANADAAITVLAELASLGVISAIDDFGTGFSSLSYLKHLPVKELKIDKSFVMNMPQDTRDQAIVAATVHMAHSLGMQAIAEGVESDLVLRMLRRAECDMAQGYLWTRPAPADTLATWLAEQKYPARSSTN
jgi:EAL domain-containing protein (putative c-di-GMP-specific phosphodiesterase class I)